MQRLLLGVRIALVAVAMGSCGGARSDEPACTQIGCISTFEAVIELPAGIELTGLHRVEAQVGGAEHTCVLGFAPDQPPADTACGGGVTFRIAPATDCRTSHEGDVVARRCDPIPGRYVARIQVGDTPSSVGIRYHVGPHTLVDTQLTPTYTEHRPNGPRCEPVCRGASETLRPELPAAGSDAWRSTAIDPRFTTCSADAECTALELGCCDHCNGGRVVAVSSSQAEEVRRRYGEPDCTETVHLGGGQFRTSGRACTELGCDSATVRCGAGRCLVADGEPN